MTKRKIQQYPIEKSPFYKLERKKDLCKLLYISEKQLKTYLKKSTTSNYHPSKSGTREIHILKPFTRTLHNRIFKLLQRIETPDYLHSGVKKRSHVTNAIQHLGHGNKIFTIDIKSFYTSTKEKFIYELFSRDLECSKDVSHAMSNISTYDGYVPTGSPISQILCFLSNKPIFDKLERLSKHNGIMMSIYVDDLTFSGKVIPHTFINDVRKIIGRKGYKTHKIKVYSKNEVKNVTGSVINPSGKIEVQNKTKKVMRELRKELNIASKKGDDEEKKLIYAKLIGHVFSASQISPGYYSMGQKLVSRRKKEYLRTSP